MSPSPSETDIAIAFPFSEVTVAAAKEALADGRRVAARISLHDPASVGLVAAAHDAGHTVLPARGLAPIPAALAVAGLPATSFDTQPESRRNLGRIAPGTARVVLGVRGDRVTAHLAGGDRGLVALDVGTPREEYLPWRAGTDLVISSGRRRSALVVVFVAPAGDGTLSASIASLAAGMLARGVSVRDVSHAVHEATGLPRRVAYDAVLALERRPETHSVARREPRTSR